jgi:GntR family transcriptional regulator
VADAKYKRIADDLRQQITSGELKPGSQLPTEPNLAEAKHASRSTIRQAINVLSNEGLVETRQGIGTYVAERPTRLTVLLSREEDWRAGEPADAALRPTGELASRPVTTKFQAERATASADVAGELNLQVDSLVMVRRSFRYLEKRPWSLVVSYYPMDIAKDTELEQAAQTAESASQVLARHGHQPVGYRHDIYARMPDALEIDFFELSTASPVTVVSRTAFDAGGPVRLTRYVYRADRLRLRHEMGSIPPGNTADQLPGPATAGQGTADAR